MKNKTGTLKAVDGIGFEQNGEPGYYIAYRVDGGKIVGAIKHRRVRHGRRGSTYEVEGLGGGMKAFPTMPQAKQAIADKYGSEKPAPADVKAAAETNEARVSRVMRDLKGQGDSQATAVLELIENVVENNSFMAATGDITDQVVEEIIEEVKDMGGWGKYAATNLRGGPVELTTECPPCQILASKSPMEPTELSRATNAMWVNNGKPFLTIPESGALVYFCNNEQAKKNGRILEAAPKALAYLKTMCHLFYQTNRADAETWAQYRCAMEFIKKMEAK